MEYEIMPPVESVLSAVEMIAFQSLYKQTLKEISNYFQSFSDPKYKEGDTVFVNYCYYKDGVAKKISNDFKLRDLHTPYKITSVFFDINPIEHLKVEDKYVVWEYILEKFIQLKTNSELKQDTIVSYLVDTTLEHLKKYSFRVQWTYTLRNCFGITVPEMALVPNDEIVREAYLKYLKSEDEVESAKQKMSVAQLIFNRTMV